MEAKIQAKATWRGEQICPERLGVWNKLPLGRLCRRSSRGCDRGPSPFPQWRHTGWDSRQGQLESLPLSQNSQIWDCRGHQVGAQAQARLVPRREICRLEDPQVGVSPEQEGISPALQEIIPPAAGGIEGDLQAGDLPPVPKFLLREQVQRLEMELQMAQQAGFRRITPPPFPASGPGLQAGDVLMADVPTSQGGIHKCVTRLGILQGRC